MKSLIIPIMLGMLSLSFLPDQSTFYNGKVLELGKSVPTIEALAQFNNIYQNNEQKIVTIMNWYNKKMPAAKKQAIADEILEMTLRYSNLWRLVRRVYYLHGHVHSPGRLCCRRLSQTRDRLGAL